MKRCSSCSGGGGKEQGAPECPSPGGLGSSLMPERPLCPGSQGCVLWGVQSPAPRVLFCRWGARLTRCRGAPRGPQTGPCCSSRSSPRGLWICRPTGTSALFKELICVLRALSLGCMDVVVTFSILLLLEWDWGVLWWPGVGAPPFGKALEPFFTLFLTWAFSRVGHCNSYWLWLLTSCFWGLGHGSDL